jgi:hypothetical protein
MNLIIIRRVGAGVATLAALFTFTGTAYAAASISVTSGTVRPGPNGRDLSVTYSCDANTIVDIHVSADDKSTGAGGKSGQVAQTLTCDGNPQTTTIPVSKSIYPVRS